MTPAMEAAIVLIMFEAWRKSLVCCIDFQAVVTHFLS